MLEIRAFPDKARGHVIILADVSELHRLQSKDDLLRRALDVIADGFAIFDSQDRLAVMNRRYLGYSPEEGETILGITFEDLMNQDSRHRFYPQVVGREAPFIEARIRVHREGAGRPINFQIGDGGWAQARDYRLADGSTVIMRSDVSEHRCGGPCRPLRT